jgi:hypothetical protein
VFSFAALLWLLITQTVADADLWGHLRFGLDLLRTHRLPQWDSYSFTADRMWVNHEWLSEAAMAVAYRAAGPLGLNLLKLTAIAVIAGLVALIGRREHAPAIDGILFAALVVLATYTRTQVIRPQLFSVPVFCLILYAISEVERQRYRALIAVPFCFALWVNLHGAWIIGLACWGCWLIAAAWTTPAKRGLFVALGVATVLATLVNPYGPDMWRFLWETVRLQRHDVTDWKPLLQLPPAIVILDLMLPLMALGAIVSGRRRPPLAHVAIVGILAFGTWRVGRIDAFLGAATGILFAPQILSGFAAIRARLQSRVWEWTAPLGHAVLSAGAIAALTVGLVNLRTIELQGTWLPDEPGVESLRRTCAGQNVLTWFDWGEYAIWHLSGDGIRVSMDGRRETIYSQQVLDDHFAFYNNEPTAIDYPDRIAADCVWLPSRLGTVTALEARGWTVVARTPVSAVLRRSGAAQPTPIVGSSSAARVFPGP